MATGATAARIDRAVPHDLDRADEILSETLEDPVDGAWLSWSSIVVMCPLDVDTISECYTADPRLGAGLEAEEDPERQLVFALQAIMQLSRALSGVPGAAPDGNGVWQEFYTRYDPWIRRAVRACRVRACDRDDCVQEVWALLLCKLETFDPQRAPCRFRRWLLTLIQRHITTLLRRPVRETCKSLGELESYPDRADLSPAAVYQTEGTRRLVREAMAELREILSALSFAVIDLRWLKERSVPDTASALGITCEQVWYHQYRAMKKLRRLLRIRGLDNVNPSQKARQRQQSTSWLGDYSSVFQNSPRIFQESAPGERRSAPICK